MTIGCEMNLPNIIENLKNHLKRYILGEKMYYHRSNYNDYYDGYHETTIVTMMVTMINLGYHRSN